MGSADIILDLVSTGVTLRENNLKQIEGGTIMHSEGALVANRRALLERPVRACGMAGGSGAAGAGGPAALVARRCAARSGGGQCASCWLAQQLPTACPLPADPRPPSLAAAPLPPPLHGLLEICHELLAPCARPSTCRARPLPLAAATSCRACWRFATS